MHKGDEPDGQVTARLAIKQIILHYKSSVAFCTHVLGVNEKHRQIQCGTFEIIRQDKGGPYIILQYK
jgi:hypothetical protein